MTIRNDLRAAVNGRILTPGDEGFDAARRPWNLAVDQRVAAVVDAADAADVAAVIRRARLAGLAVLAQPSGHGASGESDGVILLRTGGLGGVEIRPEERLARVGAGVKWGEVLTAAGRHGLTGLAGSSPVVGVTGYTLGGGLSWFSRAHGFAANSVRAFDVVDADGARHRVTAESDPELFWALRGGSGEFAVVTATEFDLHPAPELYGGRMVWPAAAAAAVLEAYREVTRTAPDELTVWYDLLQFPGAPAVVAVDATYLGPAGEAGTLLRRFDTIAGRTGDSRGPLPIAELGSVTAEPTDPGPGMSRAELLTELTDDVAEALLARPIDPLLSVQLRHLGGALARPSADAGACGGLTEPYLLYTFGIPATPGKAAAVAGRQRELAATLTPHTSGRKPYTFLAPGERAAHAFTPAVLGRLRALKRERDPRGTFRTNYPVLG
jgi:UDP-N-acetylenolpyruvoylglucosamine reductase